MQDHYKTHGAFSWNELMTTDPEAAKQFYSEVFGWETEEYPMGDFRVTVTNMFRNKSQSVSGTGIFSLRHIMLNLPH